MLNACFILKKRLSWFKATKSYYSEVSQEVLRVNMLILVMIKWGRSIKYGVILLWEFSDDRLFLCCSG